MTGTQSNTYWVRTTSFFLYFLLINGALSYRRCNFELICVLFLHYTTIMIQSFANIINDIPFIIQWFDPNLGVLLGQNDWFLFQHISKESLTMLPGQSEQDQFLLIRVSWSGLLTHDSGPILTREFSEWRIRLGISFHVRLLKKYYRIHTQSFSKWMRKTDHHIQIGPNKTLILLHKLCLKLVDNVNTNNSCWQRHLIHSLTSKKILFEYD